MPTPERPVHEIPQKLEARIVTEKEWEHLRASGKICLCADGNSMGVADPAAGRAYVRQTHWPDLNKYLLHHEFEHLLEEEGTDECLHGMRHKKFFKQIAAPVLSPLFGTTNPFSRQGLQRAGNVALSGLGGFATGGPLGAVLGATGRSLQLAAHPSEKAPITWRNALVSGGEGVGAGALGGVAGRTLGLPGAATAPGFGSSGTASRMLSGSNPAGYGPTITNAPGMASAAPQAGGAIPSGNVSGGGLSGLGRFLPSLLGGGGSSGGFHGAGYSNYPGLYNQLYGQPGKGTNQLSSFLGGILGQAGSSLGQSGYSPMNAFGAGATGAGLLAAAENKKYPDVPDFGQLPSLQHLAQTAGQPLSPVGTLGYNRLSEQLSQPLDQAAALPVDVQAGLQRQFDVENRNLMSQFKQFQPDADVTNSSDLARMTADLNQRHAETLANVQLQRRQQVEGQRRQDIASALGIDSQTLNEYMNLAQADIDTIKARLNVKTEDAAQFKQTFGNLAGLFFTKALGLNSFYSPGMSGQPQLALGSP